MPLLGTIGAAASRGFGFLTSVAVAVDEYFKYVTLLLHGNGTNGAQNNTFLDSSTNNFTITRNGNTTQGTFSPYGSNWSNYFDGSGDSVTAPSNAAFDLAGGNFTVEAFVFMTAGSGTKRTVISRHNSGTDAIWDFYVDTDNKAYFAVWSAGVASTQTIATDSTIPLNQWVHIAGGRNGSNLFVCVDGVYKSAALTITPASSPGSAIAVAVAMNSNGSSFPYTGYISSARVVKGSAVYTANYTAPTSPLSAITNTSLLTCQSNRFIDNSSNNFTITRNGDVSVQRFSPFAPTAAYSTSVIGGSGYFDGNGDELTFTTIAVGSSTAFCCEAWVYVNSLAADMVVFGGPSDFTGGADNVQLAIQSNGTVSGYLGGSYPSSAAGVITTGAWYHIAWTRNGTTGKIFVNGVEVASGSSTTAGNINRIGSVGSSGTRKWFNGYAASARIVVGSAVYTSAFTPPTAPLTAITNTSLLLNFTNGGIIDNAMMNDLETVGNAQISTSVSKFGGGSMAFDGTGDWIKMIGGPNYQFGTGDFTIEFWFNGTSVASGIPIDFRPYNTNGAYPAIYLSSGAVRYYVNTADQISGGSLSTGIWYHIALARSGTSTRLFVNGTQVGSTYSDSNNYGSSSIPVIGASSFHLDGTGAINGYIDDLRITKGIARYTSSFTPPTVAFPDK